ncbi:MAG: DNA polymerase Y family protein [Devosiaceae bacterium]
MTRRFLFVQLPFFASERHSTIKAQHNQRQKPWWDADTQVDEAAKPTGPLVLVTHGAKGTRISALGQDGLLEDLWCGMKLNDARAMLPGLAVETHDVAADRKLQTRLAHWMMRYSPSVATYGDTGFVLDVAGCTHLFGGEEKLARDISKRFKAMGFSCRLAFADTPGAAMALVNYGVLDINILQQGADMAALDDLPVEALRLDDETVIMLKRLGLKRLGDVRPLPRVALERRFRKDKKTRSKTQASGLSQAVQWRLDQLSGAAAEPLATIAEPQPFRVSKQCPELALETGAVEIALRQMLPALCAQLQKAGQGARQFSLTGYRADGGLSAVTASLSQAGYDGGAIARLFKDRFEQIDCGFGIDLFVLDASRISPVAAAQCDGLDAQSAAFSSSSIASFADVMTNRGNGARVSVFAPYASHVPERAQRFVAVNTAVNWSDWSAMQPMWAQRPLRLFARPEPAQVTAELPDSPPAQFIWRKRLRKVMRARGPERILPEWWHDTLKPKRSATFRDYYDVEDEEGLRYWIYRAIIHEPIEGSDDVQQRIDWFVHGLF